MAEEINIKELAEHLRPVIAAEIRSNMPDRFITSTEATRELGVTFKTVQKYITDGNLTNYGTGDKRPRLSYNEVIELRKNIVKGRLRKPSCKRA